MGQDNTYCGDCEIDIRNRPKSIYHLLWPRPENLTKQKIRNFSKLQFLNDKMYKKAIWHLAVWQNWCFGQF